MEKIHPILRWILFPLVFFVGQAIVFFLVTLIHDEVFPVFPINDFWDLIDIVIAAFYWIFLLLLSFAPVPLAIHTAPNIRLAAYFILPFGIISSVSFYLLAKIPIYAYDLNSFTVSICFVFGISLIAGGALIKDPNTFDS